MTTLASSRFCQQLEPIATSGESHGSAIQVRLQVGRSHRHAGIDSQRIGRAALAQAKCPQPPRQRYCCRRNQSSYLRKILDYRDIIARQIHKSHFGIPNLLVLTVLKAHRTAASLLKKGLFPDVSGARRAA
jgi:hypothetical protein